MELSSAMVGLMFRVAIFTSMPSRRVRGIRYKRGLWALIGICMDELVDGTAHQILLLCQRMLTTNKLKDIHL